MLQWRPRERGRQRVGETELRRKWKEKIRRKPETGQILLDIRGIVNVPETGQVLLDIRGIVNVLLVTLRNIFCRFY